MTSFFAQCCNYATLQTPGCNLSPAQIVFGKPIRDVFAFMNRLEKFNNPDIRLTWREAWHEKEMALRTRFVKSSESLNVHARHLSPLIVGDRCFVQNQMGNMPKKWDRSGTVVEVLDHNSYWIKIDGSHRLTKRNRQYLRKFLPAHTDAREFTLPKPVIPTENKTRNQPIILPSYPNQDVSTSLYPHQDVQPLDTRSLDTDISVRPSTTPPLMDADMVSPTMPATLPVTLPEENRVPLASPSRNKISNDQQSSSLPMTSMSSRPQRVKQPRRIYQPETGTWS
jgi:hypothetical protein